MMLGDLAIAGFDKGHMGAVDAAVRVPVKSPRINTLNGPANFISLQFRLLPQLQQATRNFRLVEYHGNGKIADQGQDSCRNTEQQTITEFLLANC